MSEENVMIKEVKNLPKFIRDNFDDLDSHVGQLMDRDECLRIKRIVTTGCGDSYMASLATELAFEKLSGIPTEPMTAMQAGQYGAAYQPKSFSHNPLTIGISVSGMVARTQEAMVLSRREGAFTVAVTSNPTSPLASFAERTLLVPQPEDLKAPGVSSYRLSLLALYLIAIRFGEANGRIGLEDGKTLRRTIKETADIIERTIELNFHRAQELANAVTNQTNFVFLGYGPNFGTALFYAAKVIEAAGRHAIGQDMEEWAHLQYFTKVNPATPTFLISPGGHGHGRAKELIEPIKRIGRILVSVVPQEDKLIAPQVEWNFPIPGNLPEWLTPIVYPVPGELFAAYLSNAVAEPFFREKTDAYIQGNNTIRTSHIFGR